MIFYLKTTHVQYLEVGLLSKIPLLPAIQQFATCKQKIQGFWTKLWTLVLTGIGPLNNASTRCKRFERKDLSKFAFIWM